jgi:hypothetical protein
VADLERRLRSVAKALDYAEALPPQAPRRKLLDTLFAAFEDLIEHVLPIGDRDMIDACLCTIEAGLVRLDPFDVAHEDPQASRAAERRKLRPAHAYCAHVRAWRRPLRPVPRPSRRERRPRTARRRAAGLRSGQDPGDEGEPDSEHAASQGAAR